MQGLSDRMIEMVDEGQRTGKIIGPIHSANGGPGMCPLTLEKRFDQRSAYSAMS